MKILFRLAFLSAMAMHGAQADAIRYTITNLGGLGGSVTRPLGINDSGYVVGEATTSDNLTRAFIYNPENGSINALATLAGGTAGGASALNATGIITGQSNISTNTSYHAVLYALGGATDLGTLGGVYSQGRAINDQGDISGEATTAGGAFHAFLRRNDGSNTLTDLGTLGGANSYARGINSIPLGQGAFFTQFVGYSLTAQNQNHAFLYSGMTMTDLGTLGGTGSIAYDINDAGNIVGESLIANDAAGHAFYQGISAVLEDLGTLGGGGSSAVALNNAEQIVGYSEISGSPTRHAFLYESGVMRDLNTRVDSLGGWVLNEATAINESGQIVGVGTLAEETRGFLLTPHNVPSPTVAISGKAKIKTSKKKLTIRGTASGDVTRVTWQIKGKAVQTATGTSAWSLNTGKLKNGKTTITVISQGYGGDSAPQQVVITKR